MRRLIILIVLYAVMQGVLMLSSATSGVPTLPVPTSAERRASVTPKLFASRSGFSKR